MVYNCHIFTEVRNKGQDEKIKLIAGVVIIMHSSYIERGLRKNEDRTAAEMFRSVQQEVCAWAVPYHSARS